VTYAEARELALADPKIKACVESAPEVPLRDSKHAHFQVFSLVKDAAKVFDGLCEQHEADGWVAEVGSKSKGFAVYRREEETFAVSLDKRSLHNHSDEG